MANMIRAITEDGGAVICALDSTNIVKRMEEIHHPSAVVSAALGRLLTAASLMGSWLKHPEDSMTLRMDGGGPIGLMLAVSDGNADVRGYAHNNVVEIPLRADGKLDVGSAVGTDGTLAVVRDMGMKEPYIGQTSIVSGEVAEDITAYYAASEQTPTVCALGVLVNPDLSIRRAGGFLLQLLPGADDATVSAIEKNVAAMPPVTELLEAGGTPQQMIETALKGLSPQITEERDTEYRCHCSREKTADILASLGADEIEDMKQDSATAQVECHFCNCSYLFDLDEISQDILTAKKEDK